MTVRQEDFLSAGYVYHLLDVFGFVDLQPGNRTIRDARIIIDQSHGTQDSAHAKCCNQLIAGYACTVDGDFGEAIIPVGERYMLRGGDQSPMKY